jgi:hypothetical protein
MALPATHDLNAYRGDSWSQTFRLLRDATPVDLSGATVQAEARAVDGSRRPLSVVVDGPNGLVTIGFAATGQPGVGIHHYDVEVTDAGVVTTWVAGRLCVTRDVTNEQP